MDHIRPLLLVRLMITAISDLNYEHTGSQYFSRSSTGCKTLSMSSTHAGVTYMPTPTRYDESVKRMVHAFSKMSKPLHMQHHCRKIHPSTIVCSSCVLDSLPESETSLLLHGRTVWMIGDSIMHQFFVSTTGMFKKIRCTMHKNMIHEDRCNATCAVFAYLQYTWTRFGVAVI